MTWRGDHRAIGRLAAFGITPVDFNNLASVSFAVCLSASNVRALTANVLAIAAGVGNNFVADRSLSPKVEMKRKKPTPQQ
jgi:putative flippase GtrA